MNVRHFLTRYKHHIVETWSLSLPIILGRFGAVMMGVTDNMMVGKVGYTSLAAAGIANAVFFLLSIIPIGVMVIGSPMVSGAYGRSEKATCVSILRSCIQVSMLVSLAIFIILLVLYYYFDWFKQDPDVTYLARPYFLCVAFSIFPLMFFIAVEQFTDGLHHTSISMFFNLSGLLVNFGVNFILIFGQCGFPAMGLLGAGVGTLIARSYMAVGIWLVVRKHRLFSLFDTGISLLKVEANMLKHILFTGLPSGMQFFFEVSAFALGAVIVGWLGSKPLAAHNLALSIASVTYMISTGIASAGSIRVGHYFGSHDFIGLRKASIVSFSFVIFLMLFFSFLILISKSYLVPIFTTDTEVVWLSHGLLVLVALWQVSDGVQITALGALRAIQDVHIPMYVTLISYWIVALPLGYFLGFTLDMGVFGVWIGLVLGLSASAIFMSYRFFDLVRQKLH